MLIIVGLPINFQPVLHTKCKSRKEGTNLSEFLDDDDDFFLVDIIFVLPIEALQLLHLVKGYYMPPVGI